MKSTNQPGSALIALVALLFVSSAVCAQTNSADAFAGIEMKSGVLVIGGTPQGYLGANKRGGTIYAHGATALPPSKALAVTGNDIALVSRHLGISQLQAMMFKKFV